MFQTLTAPQATALTALATRKGETTHITARSLGHSAAALNSLVRQGLAERVDTYDTDMVTKGHYAITEIGLELLSELPVPVDALVAAVEPVAAAYGATIIVDTVDGELSQISLVAPEGLTWAANRLHAINYHGHPETVAELVSELTELASDGLTMSLCESYAVCDTCETETETVTVNHVSAAAHDTFSQITKAGTAVAMGSVRYVETDKTVTATVVARNTSGQSLTTELHMTKLSFNLRAAFDSLEQRASEFLGTALASLAN